MSDTRTEVPIDPDLLARFVFPSEPEQIGKKVPITKFSDDQPRDESGRWSSGDIAPAPGTIPVRPGNVRLFHITPIENLEAIRREGLTMAAARGEEKYAQANMIWATAGKTDDRADDSSSQHVIVEFQASPDDLDVGHGASPDDLENRRADVTLLHDVSPADILAIHEPWQAAYRYLSDYVDEVKAGEFDHASSMPAYERAIAEIKRITKYAEGQERDEAGRFAGPGGGSLDTSYRDTWKPEMTPAEGHAWAKAAGTKYEATVVHVTDIEAVEGIIGTGFHTEPPMIRGGQMGDDVEFASVAHEAGAYFALDTNTAEFYYYQGNQAVSVAVVLQNPLELGEILDATQQLANAAFDLGNFRTAALEAAGYSMDDPQSLLAALPTDHGPGYNALYALNAPGGGYTMEDLAGERGLWNDVVADPRITTEAIKAAGYDGVIIRPAHDADYDPITGGPQLIVFDKEQATVIGTTFVDRSVDGSAEAIASAFSKFAEDQPRDESGRWTSGSDSDTFADAWTEEPSWEGVVAYAIEHVTVTEPLNEQETAVVGSYVGSGFETMNAGLRGISTPDWEATDKLDEYDERDKLILDAAIEKSVITENVMLYRGIIDPPAAMLKEGAVVSDKAYLSTSLNLDTAENFAGGNFRTGTGWRVDIQAPAGTHGLYVTDAMASSDGEFEVLLGRDTVLTVMNVDEDNRVVQARVGERIAKYSDDQSRDDHGRFAGPGSSGLSDVSPVISSEAEKNNTTLFQDFRMEEVLYDGSREHLKAENVMRITELLGKEATADPALKDQLLTMDQYHTQDDHHQMAYAAETFMDRADLMNMSAIDRAAAYVAAQAQNSWAGSASDSNEMSLAIQIAVADKFGIDLNETKFSTALGTGNTPLAMDAPARLGLMDDPRVQEAALPPGPAYTSYFDEQGVARTAIGVRMMTPFDTALVLADSPAIKAYVEVVYKSTQEYLASNGITELALQRGVSWSKPDEVPEVFRSFTEDRGGGSRVITADLNPMSSFSTSSPVAYDFASGRPLGIMLLGSVPADRVFSVPMTGPGCLDEGEVIVIGGHNIKFTAEAVY
jgi:hypothetical protein